MVMVRRWILACPLQVSSEQARIITNKCSLAEQAASSSGSPLGHVCNICETECTILYLRLSARQTLSRHMPPLFPTFFFSTFREQAQLSLVCLLDRFLSLFLLSQLTYFLPDLSASLPLILSLMAMDV